LTTLSGTHTGKCETIAFHPSNSYFVSGGHDSLIGFWDLDELICTGTLSVNHLQIKKLDFSACGNYLAALCYDEI